MTKQNKTEVLDHLYLVMSRELRGTCLNAFTNEHHKPKTCSRCQWIKQAMDNARTELDSIPSLVWFVDDGCERATVGEWRLWVSTLSQSHGGSWSVLNGSIEINNTAQCGTTAGAKQAVEKWMTDNGIIFRTSHKGNTKT